MIEFKLTDKGKQHFDDVDPVVGVIPFFVTELNDAPAREQFNEAYVGGWRPFQGFTYNKETHALMYPGDPKMYPLAEGRLRDELILVYPYSWVVIVQPDGSFEVCRMD